MKLSHASITATLFAGVLLHAPAASAALPDHGLVSVAGTTGTPAVWTYDASPANAIGPGFTASAQTDYAIKQATSGTTSNTLAYAGSVWWDRYTISGGTGGGSADFSALLNGGLNVSGLANAGVGYVLLISPSLPAAFNLDFSTLTAANTSSWLDSQLSAYTPGGATVLAYYVNGVSPVAAGKMINQTFSGSFGFTYDAPFYIGAALLNGAGGNSGTANFLNTATFHLTLAAGDTLTMASSVPEPGEWILLLAGLGLIGLRLKGRGNRTTG